MARDNSSRLGNDGAILILELLGSLWYGKHEPALVKVISGAIELATGSLDNNYQLTSVSGIKLNPTDGIWMGSDKKISLFASDNNGSTANVEISPAHIFFGMNNTGSNDTTALEITESKFLLASAGTVFTTTKNNGIKIK